MPHPPVSASGVLGLQGNVICPASSAGGTHILFTRTERLFFLTNILQGSLTQGIIPGRGPLSWEHQCTLHNNMFPMARCLSGCQSSSHYPPSPSSQSVNTYSWKASSSVAVPSSFPILPLSNNIRRSTWYSPEQSNLIFSHIMMPYTGDRRISK